MKWAKNVHFIELFVYKQVQLLPSTPYYFIFSIFPVTLSFLLIFNTLQRIRPFSPSTLLSPLR